MDAPAFTPDGNTVIFDVYTPKSSTIMVSHRINGEWTRPELVPFSGQWIDQDPAMAPDGSFLVFVSNRPPFPGGKPVEAVVNGKVSPWGGHLWRVKRKGDGWGVPTQLPNAINSGDRTFAPSIANDGSLYFTRPDHATNAFHIVRAQYHNGNYMTPVRLLLGAPTASTSDPAIAPDESFMAFLYNANGRQHARMAIAFRICGRGWTNPVDLGDKVNGNYHVWDTHLGPDHSTLYFTSDRPVPGLQKGGVAKIWYLPLTQRLDATRRQASCNDHE
ncbi:MAG: hypothetical protein ABI076_12600 [Acidobacteriaceae bacterium]